MPLLLIAIFTIYIAYIYYVINEVSYKLPELYDELGRPTRLVVSFSQLSFLYFFILPGEYKDRISDEQLKKQCFLLQIVMAILHIIIVSILIWALIL